MPSASLTQWTVTRMPRLAILDAHCSAVLAAVPPNSDQIDESLRGFVLLLSAHFQGFCRDLYTECAQIIASKVRPGLQLLIQEQFSAHRKLDHGNPNMRNLKEDFGTFGFSLNLSDAANAPRVTQLGMLNEWRNAAAHQGNAPAAAGPLTLPSLQTWRTACDGLATALDDTIRKELRRILRRQPW